MSDWTKKRLRRIAERTVIEEYEYAAANPPPPAENARRGAQQSVEQALKDRVASLRSEIDRAYIERKAPPAVVSDRMRDLLIARRVIQEHPGAAEEIREL
ncbi:hypothetical protein R0137_10970 [Congregibacter brevis]|uniref:Uncharacterized protein n=1 Tax=Congregibacter brevis TaxID=3081201 RepID=A0ABZ0I9J7_9GAMM|nr:hypothetical protein R0137_10970 [Congregibacter sp. IMCC45268]